MTEYAVRWKVGDWSQPWQWRGGFASLQEADRWRAAHTSAFTWEFHRRDADEGRWRLALATHDGESD